MEKIKLDKKDKAILKALEEDGRAQIKEIAKKTNIPRDSVKYRLDKMVKDGVILGFRPVCDTRKLGHPVLTYMNIELQIFDEALEKKFQAFLKNNNHVIYVARITGAFQYTVAIAAENIPELDKVVRSILSNFPKLIKSYHTSLLIEEIQQDTFYRLMDV